MRLQINHIGYEENIAKFEVVRCDDGKRSKSVLVKSPVELMGKDFLPDLKWYMEKYLELPVGAYVDKARKTEQDIRTWGGAVFDSLFCGDAAYWFNRACDEGLDKLQIRITSGNDDLVVLSWPWEALYQERVGYIAIQSSIERRLQNVMDPVDLPKDLPRDVINVLYVIARPYGRRM
jgi:hypothetical protein